MKTKILFIFLAVILAGCTAIPGTGNDSNSSLKTLELSTGIGIVELKTELALTPAQQEQGLMLREFLPQNQGMLFVFNQEQMLSFWMKNTKIPLDIVFLDKEGKIINIAENAQPCLDINCTIFNSEKNALYVLEINAEKSKQWELDKGIQLFRTTDVEKIIKENQ